MHVIAVAGRAGSVRRWAFLVVSITLVWTDAQAADPPPEASTAAGTAESAPASSPGGHEVSRVECFKHHEDAQIARRERRLLDARSSVRLCSRASCPGAIRADCVDWFEEVNRSVPSVVVTARARGRDVTDVKVFVDDKLIAERLTGAAFEFDPGEHRFLFQSLPWPNQEYTILVSEGVKGRAIDIEFAPPLPVAATPAPRPPDPARRTSLHPANRFDYVVGGVGAASLATAAAFGGWALWLRHHYESTCAPFCDAEEKASVGTRFVIADAALGLAVVSAVVVYFHLARPHPPGPAVAAFGTGLTLLLGASSDKPELGIRGAF